MNNFIVVPNKSDNINDILKYLNDNELLNDDGIIVCEFEDEDVYSDCFNLIKSRRYGSKNVEIYKKL